MKYDSDDSVQIQKVNAQQGVRNVAAPVLRSRAIVKPTTGGVDPAAVVRAREFMIQQFGEADFVIEGSRQVAGLAAQYEQDGLREIYGNLQQVRRDSAEEFSRQIREESDREWRATIAEINKILPGVNINADEFLSRTFS